MISHLSVKCECLSTNITVIWLLTSVNPIRHFNLRWLMNLFPANITLIMVIFVNPHIFYQKVKASEFFSTCITFVWNLMNRFFPKNMTCTLFITSVCFNMCKAIIYVTRNTSSNTSSIGFHFAMSILRAVTCWDVNIVCFVVLIIFEFIIPKS